MRSAAVSILAILSTALTAAEPYLVKDINVSKATFGASSGVAVGSTYIFAYNNGGGAGEELWRVDPVTGGTALLADIAPGAASSKPTYFMSNGALAAFSAWDPVHGKSPWVSDGTPAGTRCLATAAAVLNDSDPAGFLFAGQNLYFIATTAASGRELWVLESGAQTPHLVADLNPGSGSTFLPTTSVPIPPYGYSTPFPNPFRAAFGAQAMYFIPRTTSITKDFYYDFFYPVGPCDLAVFSPTGATILKSGLTVDEQLMPMQSYGVTSGGSLYFPAKTAGEGMELWRSDGTAAGTVLIRDLNSGSGDSSPGNFAVLGSSVFFNGQNGPRTPGDAQAPRTLWRTDGTAGGTVQVININPNDEFYGAMNLTTFAGKLWFATMKSGTRAAALWSSDGTAGGTTILASFPDTNTVDNPFNVIGLQPAGGRLWFFAGNTTIGKELYSTDGTIVVSAGDLVPGTTGVYPENDVRNSTALDGTSDGRTFLMARNESLSQTLWMSRGGAGDGIRLATARYSRANSMLSSLFATGDGRAIFSAFDPSAGMNVWITDGTEAGTRVLLHPGLTVEIDNGALSEALFDAAAIDGKVWMSVSDQVISAGVPGSAGLLGYEPWVLDLTTNQTRLVDDIYPGTYDQLGGVRGGNSSSPSQFTKAGNWVYFTASTPTTGLELHRSNGTGSELVIDLNTGSGSSVPRNLGVLNGKLLFTATTPGTGTEWWAHDPVAGTTAMLRDIAPGAGSGALAIGGKPRQYAILGGYAYMLASDGGNSRQLWRTDGTSAGTTLVKTIQSAGDTTSNFYSYMGVGNGRIYFDADDGSSGDELWTSDGTAAGTVRVSDIRTGAFGSSPRDFTMLGMWCYFSADDGSTGRELWRTDGATATRVADAVPGSAGLDPLFLVGLNGQLLFSGINGVGRELWTYDGTSVRLLADLDPANQTYGGQPFINGQNPLANSDIQQIVSGNTLLFTAETPESGRELWAYVAQPSGGAGVIAFQNSTMIVSEAAGAALIPVTRTGGTGSVSVSYGITAGTAVSGQRYLPVSGTLTFAAGQTEAQIVLPLLAQPGIQGDQNLVVSLTNPTNGDQLGLFGVLVTITDAFASNTNLPPVAVGGSVQVAGATATAITLAGYDPNGTAVSVVNVGSPSHGTLIGSGSSRTYTPTAGYAGPDSITFQVSDGTLTSATATIAITVVASSGTNQAPIIAVPAAANGATVILP